MNRETIESVSTADELSAFAYGLAEELRDAYCNLPCAETDMIEPILKKAAAIGFALSALTNAFDRACANTVDMSQYGFGKAAYEQWKPEVERVRKQTFSESFKRDCENWGSYLTYLTSESGQPENKAA